MAQKEKKFIVREIPKPQPRPRVTRYGTYDPAHDEKSYVRFLLEKQVEEKLYKQIEAPIELEARFFLPVPKSMSKKNAVLMLDGAVKHKVRPDCDNLYKFITDCMNGLIYKDDAQIYKCYIEKFYSLEPRTEITVRWEE